MVLYLEACGAIVNKKNKEVIFEIRFRLSSARI